MLNLEYFEYDKYLNKQLKKTTFLFKNIHPNCITIFGCAMNGLMIYFYFIKKNKFITSILLFIRILCDNLDGMVARKFNRVSKMGGLLDSLADCFLLSTIWYAFLIYIRVPYSFCISIILGCGMLWYLIVQDAVFLHINFKNDGSFLNKIVIFLSENTYLQALFVIIMMYIT